MCHDPSAYDWRMMRYYRSKALTERRKCLKRLRLALFSNVEPLSSIGVLITTAKYFSKDGIIRLFDPFGLIESALLTGILRVVIGQP